MEPKTDTKSIGVTDMELNPTQKIDMLLETLPEWRKVLISDIRRTFLEVSPEIEESWKWDCPVWTSKGNIASVGLFQEHVKLNFFQGALLTNFQHVFNAGLEAKASRGIDFHEGDKVSADIVSVIQAACELSLKGKRK